MNHFKDIVGGDLVIKKRKYIRRLGLKIILLSNINFKNYDLYNEKESKI